MPTPEELQSFLNKRGLKADITIRKGEDAFDTYILVCSPADAWRTHLALAAISQPGRFIIYGKPASGVKEALKNLWREVKKCLVAYLRRSLLKKKA